MSTSEPGEPEQVPVEELVDVTALGRHGRPPTPAQLRAALPVGWVLAEDGRTARRDGRIFHRHSIVLLSGLIFFGVAGLGLFWSTFPRGWSGFARASSGVKTSSPVCRRCSSPRPGPRSFSSATS